MGRPYDEGVVNDLTNIFHPDGGSLKTYTEMMPRMDANVGRILATLKEKGLDESTIAVFASDNCGEKFFSISNVMLGMNGLFCKRVQYTHA